MTTTDENHARDLALAEALLGWIQQALDGEEPSDFALSFPLVRRVWDLRQQADGEKP